MERLSVRVIPNAPRDEVIGFENAVLKVRVRAVPENGKANKAVIQLLAKASGSPRSSIAIVVGERGRNKVVALPAEAAHRLWSDFK